LKILALDLGSKTGWAFVSSIVKQSDVEDFTPGPRESKGMRFVRFHAWINEILDKLKPDMVIYEMPHNRGGYATQVLNGMVAYIFEECLKREIEYEPVHSRTLKKYAMGSGRASKEDMIREAEKRFDKPNLTSDEADALWLLDYGNKKLNKEGGK